MLSQPLGRLPLAAGVLFGIALGALFTGVMPLTELHPVFVLAVPFFCALLLFLVVKPGAILVGLLLSRALLDPVLNVTRADGGVGFGAVFNLLVVMITAFLLLRAPQELSRSSVFKPWLIFLALALASVAYSPVPFQSFRMVVTLTSYLCMTLLPALVAPEKDDRRFWVKVLVASSVLPVMFANLDLVRGGASFSDAGSRILGTFTHPNILAFYLLWVIALLFFVLKSGLFRLNFWSGSLVMLYMLNVMALMVATKTRNAWVGTWLLFFLYGVIKERKYLLFSLALLGAAMAIPDVNARVMDLFQYRTQQVNSWAWRIEVWKSGLGWIGQRWAFGYGLSSFHELSRQFVFSEKGGADAHNTYFQLLFEVGAVGLIAFVAIFWKMLRALRTRYRNSVGRLSSGYAVMICYTVIYLLSGIADNNLYYLALNWYCWFFWGVILKPVKLKQATHAPMGRRLVQPWRPRPHHAKTDR